MSEAGTEDPEAQSPPPTQPKDNEDDKKMAAPALDANPDKEAYQTESEKEDAEARKKKKRIALALCLLCHLIILAIVLGILLQPEDGSVALVVATPTVSSPTTPAPSAAPVTPAPTDDDATASPTRSPTDEITFPPVSDVSRLACLEIQQEGSVAEGNQASGNFEIEEINGELICGDVYSGPDPDRPNRNHWHATIGRRDCPELDYAASKELCEGVGARLCGATEINNLVAQGKGCGSDNMFIWSGTPCPTDEEPDGYYQINIEFKEDRGDTPFWRCQTDLADTTVVKCCGDADNSPKLVQEDN